MKTMLNRCAMLLVLALGILVLLMPTSAVYAAEHAVVRQQDTTIQHGQTMEDVLVLGHNITVSGKVSEILVVIDGNIHLMPTAQTEIVVDLGGSIRQDGGAQVESMYQVALSTPFWNGALFGGTVVFLLWIGMLVVGMAMVLLSVLISFLFHRQITSPLSYIEHSLRRVGLTGVFVSLFVLAIGALCTATIIGLPLAGVLLILYLVAGAIGFSIVSQWLGKLIMRNSPNDHSFWMLNLIGSSLIMVSAIIPIVGFLLFCIFWLTGVGTVMTWVLDIWRVRRQKKQRS